VFDLLKIVLLLDGDVEEGARVAMSRSAIGDGRFLSVSLRRVSQA